MELNQNKLTLLNPSFILCVTRITTVTQLAVLTIIVLCFTSNLAQEKSQTDSLSLTQVQTYEPSSSPETKDVKVDFAGEKVAVKLGRDLSDKVQENNSEQSAGMTLTTIKVKSSVKATRNDSYVFLRSWW